MLSPVQNLGRNEFTIPSVLSLCVLHVVSYCSIDPIHKWRLFYFRSVIVQISLPSLALEQEFFSI